MRPNLEIEAEKRQAVLDLASLRRQIRTRTETEKALDLKIQELTATVNERKKQAAYYKKESNNSYQDFHFYETKFLRLKQSLSEELSFEEITILEFQMRRNETSEAENLRLKEETARVEARSEILERRVSQFPMQIEKAEMQVRQTERKLAKWAEKTTAFLRWFN